MSALFAAFQLDDAALPPIDLDAVRGAMGGFGSRDSEQVFERPGSLIWTIGREVGWCRDDRAVSVVDGRWRIPSAMPLVQSIHALPSQDTPGVDAEYAALRFDFRARNLILRRDCSGHRGLRWRRLGHTVLVASRSRALFVAMAQPVTISALAITHYFALRSPPCGESWFESVRDVAAGERIAIDRAGASSQPSPPFVSAPRLSFDSDEAAGAAWFAAVEAAVERQLTDAHRPAISLSGGVDSSLLAVAARRFHPVLLSWSVPRFPSSHEAPLAAQTASALGLPHWAVESPKLPLDEVWLVEDEAPIANPYRALNQAVFSAAAERGVDVMLSGNFGDHLYAEYPQWARSLCQERGALALLRPTLQRRRDRGWLRAMTDPGFRLSAWRGRVQPWTVPWLSAEARSRLAREPAVDAFARRMDQAAGRSAQDDAELARRFHLALGLELRHPYRDPDLARFALGLPAHYSASPLGSKRLSRWILGQFLPAEIALRPKSGSLAPILSAGLAQHRDLIGDLISDPASRWRDYLEPGVLGAAFADPQTESQQLLLWLLTSFELWWRAHADRGPAVLASAHFSS